MLAVSGTAGTLTLGSSGTLKILPGGPIQSGSYTLATAGSLSGHGEPQRAGASTGLPRAAATLSSSGGSLFLRLTAAPVGGRMDRLRNRELEHRHQLAEQVGAELRRGLGHLWRQHRGHRHPGRQPAGERPDFQPTTGGSYTITAAGGDTTSKLKLNNGATAATVTNGGGNQTIAAPVILRNSLAVNAEAGTLTFSGPISGGTSSSNVTFIGGGTVILSGSNTYSGSTTVAGFVTAATPASLPG